ncbi:MAG: DUF695 domain-containing protein [Bdellovibrionales bacterium]|nr:DUF695 domain-containing protein [Bdellovibrionales bacterium]
MGAWSTEVFSNDIASDWLDQFIAYQHPLDAVQRAFDVVLTRFREELVLEPFGSTALAAAGILAARSGYSALNVPPDVAPWMRFVPSPEATLVRQALVVLERLDTHSEYAELWEQAGDAAEWRAGVRGCIDALRNELPQAATGANQKIDRDRFPLERVVLSEGMAGSTLAVAALNVSLQRYPFAADFPALVEVVLSFTGCDRRGLPTEHEAVLLRQIELSLASALCDSGSGHWVARQMTSGNYLLDFYVADGTRAREQCSAAHMSAGPERSLQVSVSQDPAWDTWQPTLRRWPVADR